MSAGVYRLEHEPTGRFYIGSSMRLEKRRREWELRLIAASERGRRNSMTVGMFDFARETTVEQWCFVVLRRFDVIDRASLVAAELEFLLPGLGDPRSLNVGRSPKAAGSLTADERGEPHI